MRSPILFLLLFLPMQAFSQKSDSLQMDTLLSAFRHDFVEKQFIYCVDRIDKLEKKVEKMEDEKELHLYLIVVLLAVTIVSYRYGWLEKLRKKE